MPLCPLEVKTTIEWQYPGEPKQRIEGADNYSIQSSYDLSANQRYRYVASGAIVRNGTFQGWDTEFKSGSSWQFNGIQSWYVHFNKTLRVNGVTVQAIKNGFPPDDSFDYYADGTLPSAAYRSITPTIWTLSQGSWTPLILPSGTGIWIKRWEPVNLATATTQCQFKVFKNDQTVYQKTKTTCPAVTYFCGDKCPEGTCQCESGGVVCCYDTATGKAVKSFKK